MSSTEATPMITLPFEEPVAEIDRQIKSLEEREDAKNYKSELSELQETRINLLEKLYENITPWQTVKVSRHPDRPQWTDCIRMICRDFRALHGDRRFGDVPAILT